MFLAVSLLLVGGPMDVPAPIYPAPVHSALVADAIVEIQAKHLDSKEGRLAFLVDEMQPFTAQASALNEAVQDLFRQTQDPANQSQILEIAETLEQKLAVLEPMLPILLDSSHLDEDFQQIDAVLVKSPPLEQNEEEMLLRVARISAYVANMDLNAAANP